METEKVYAKNPAEIVLDNPSKKKSKSKAAKDPRRVAAGRKAWKTRQNKRKKKKTDMSKNRMNPKDLTDTGITLYKQYGMAALGTILSLGGASYLLNRFGANLPNNVKRLAPIVIPGAVGVVVATKAKKNNAIAQGVAGGMVYNSATKAIQMLLPDSLQGDLSGPLAYDKSSMLGSVPAGSYVVTPQGKLLNMDGSPAANAQAALPAPKAKPMAKSSGPEFAGFGEQDFGFEAQEQF